MSILIDHRTRVLIQGVTGTEGARACRDMRAYGTEVVAGVTPGKGGQQLDDIPVYNSVSEAKAAHPDIDTTLVVVPARFAKDAILEAVDARIPLINVLTEQMPVADVALCLAHAKKAGVRVVGPSSIGIITPGVAKVGSIAMGEMVRAYKPGGVGLVSKSGGMTSEIAFALNRGGYGVSTALGIGADALTGTPFAELFALFERDDATQAVVLFGEVGGTYEEQAAALVREGGCKKPVVALIAGNFGDLLPEETVLGHAGAVVSRGRGSYASKVEALRNAGVFVVERVEDIVPELKKHGI